MKKVKLDFDTGIIGVVLPWLTIFIQFSVPGRLFGRLSFVLLLSLDALSFFFIASPLQELDVLHVIRHWVSRDPVTRSRHLPQLLSLVSVAELPAGLPLSAHLPVTQLGSSPEARSALSTLSALVNRKDQSLSSSSTQHRLGRGVGDSNHSSSRGDVGALLPPPPAAAAAAAAMARCRQNAQQQQQQGVGCKLSSPSEARDNGQQQQWQQQALGNTEVWLPTDYQKYSHQATGRNESGVGVSHSEPGQQQQQQFGRTGLPDASQSRGGDQTVAGSTAATASNSAAATAAAVAGPGTSSSSTLSYSSSADTLMRDASCGSFSHEYNSSPLWTCNSSGTTFIYPTTSPATTSCTSGSGQDGGLGSGLISGFGWSSAPRRRSHRPTRLLVAGGHDLSWRSLSFAEVLDPLEGAWAPVAGLPAAMSFAGAALLDRSVYVVEGAMFSSVVARYDPGADSWSSCAGLNTPRLHAAVAAAAGREGEG